MLSEIKLSIIIPAYNPGKKIIPCIEALERNLVYLSTQTNLIYEIFNFDNDIKDFDLSFVKGLSKLSY